MARKPSAQNNQGGKEGKGGKGGKGNKPAGNNRTNTASNKVNKPAGKKGQRQGAASQAAAPPEIDRRFEHFVAATIRWWTEHQSVVPLRDAKKAQRVRRQKAIENELIKPRWDEADEEFKNLWRDPPASTDEYPPDSFFEGGRRPRLADCVRLCCRVLGDSPALAGSKRAASRTSSRSKTVVESDAEVVVEGSAGRKRKTPPSTPGSADADEHQAPKRPKLAAAGNDGADNSKHDHDGGEPESDYSENSNDLDGELPNPRMHDIYQDDGSTGHIQRKAQQIIEARKEYLADEVPEELRAQDPATYELRVAQKTLKLHKWQRKARGLRAIPGKKKNTAWGFAKYLGSGGYGCATLWLHYNRKTGKILRNTVIKDQKIDAMHWNDTAKWEWQGVWPPVTRVPKEAAIHKRFSAVHRGDCIVKYLGHHVREKYFIWRLYTKYAECGDLWHFCARLHEKNHCVPEPFVWYVFKMLVKGLICMERGPEQQRDPSTGVVPGWVPVVHLDIKSLNILLGDFAFVEELGGFDNTWPVPMFTDFGSAIELDGRLKNPDELVTHAQTTPGFVTPEQYNFFREPRFAFSAATNVFQVGVTIYEVMEGETPLGDLDLHRRRETARNKVVWDRKKNFYRGGYSRRLKDAVWACLQRIPEYRSTLDELLKEVTNGFSESLSYHHKLDMQNNWDEFSEAHAQAALFRAGRNVADTELFVDWKRSPEPLSDIDRESQ